MIRLKDGRLAQDVVETPEMEDKAQRSLTGKNFVIGTDTDGNEVRRTIVTPAPANYWDGEKYRTLNPQWTREVDGSYSLSGHHAQVTVPAGEIAYRYEAFDGEVVETKLVRIGNVTDFTVAPIVDEHRLVFPDAVLGFDVVMVPHRAGMTVHKIIKTPTAPKSITWEVTAAAAPKVRISRTTAGRDNINKLVARETFADTHRLLETTRTDTKGRGLSGGRRRYLSTIEWTGRVLKITPRTRSEEWITDVAYPVRMV